MKTKLSLCFGISLVITGVIGFLFETNSIILLGVSISAILFSIINLMILVLFYRKESDVLELLYILPFAILLIFCCYNEELYNIEFINRLASGRVLNAISFISFGYSIF